jgi:hypothetical protein
VRSGQRVRPDGSSKLSTQKREAESGGATTVSKNKRKVKQPTTATAPAKKARIKRDEPDLIDLVEEYDNHTEVADETVTEYDMSRKKAV